MLLLCFPSSGAGVAVYARCVTRSKFPNRFAQFLHLAQGAKFQRGCTQGPCLLLLVTPETLGCILSVYIYLRTDNHCRTAAKGEASSFSCLRKAALVPPENPAMLWFPRAAPTTWTDPKQTLRYHHRAKSRARHNRDPSTPPGRAFWGCTKNQGRV